MFGWGTGNNPTNKSSNYDDYPTFVDWGVNKIGSDAPNTWRSLTKEEWAYIILGRYNAEELKGVAQVNGVNGLILLLEFGVIIIQLPFLPPLGASFNISKLIPNFFNKLVSLI